MGKVDIATKNYMRDAEVFADAFNYFMYGGRQVIDPAQLSPLDPVEIGMMSEDVGSIGAGDLVQRYRDLLKLASLMADERAVYLLLGIENQANVNYAMPVKHMSYDAQQYASQVASIARKHRKEEAHHKHKGEEYMSGFYKGDRLIPVITLVVFFGPDRWDGPLSLHEMMDVADPGILSLVQDYKLHLIEPAALEPEDFVKFRSSLREVLSFIKYSQDKTKISELMKENERFQALDSEAALVLHACTKINMKMKKETEAVNVCKAIDDLMADSRAEGREEGRKEGREEGRKEGRKLERAKTERARRRAERERKKAEREKQRADLAEAELQKLREELAQYKKGA